MQDILYAEGKLGEEKKALYIRSFHPSHYVKSGYGCLAKEKRKKRAI